MKRKHPKKARMASAKTVERKATQAVNEIVQLENMGYHIPMEIQNKMYELRNNPTKQQMTTLTRETSPEYIKKHAYMRVDNVLVAGVTRPVTAISDITAYDIEKHPLQTVNKMLHQEVTNPDTGVTKTIYSHATEPTIAALLDKFGYDLYDLQPGYDTDYFRIDETYNPKHPEDIQKHITFKNVNTNEDIAPVISKLAHTPYTDKSVYEAYRETVDEKKWKANIKGTVIYDDQMTEDLQYLLNNSQAWQVAQKSIKYEEGDRARYQELVDAVAMGYQDVVSTGDAALKHKFLDEIQQFLDNDQNKSHLDDIYGLIDEILRKRK